MRPYPYESCARTLAAVAAALTLAACGSKAPIESLNARAVGDNVLIEGTMTLRGSMPHPDMYLVMDDGTEVIIESKELRDELRNLGGLPVAIEGEMKSMRDDVPRVEAKSYELLRLPSGEIPVMGILRIDSDALILDATNGKHYWIRGDLVGVIGDYVGARIWVTGSLGDSGPPPQPKGTIAYWVTGYGVLNEEPN